MAYGTLQVIDTLQSLLVSNGTVAQIGEDNVWQAIDAALTAHNRILSELFDNFVDVSVSRLRRYGGADNMAMEELDELGASRAQKISGGVLIGAPLRLFGIGLQWTRDYFMIAQASELAAQVTAALTADIRNIQRDIKRALFFTANYTWIDRYIDGASLAVKRLLNADSQPIPLGPNGETFNAATHTHYIYAAGAVWGSATGAQVDTDLTALVNTIAEHFNEGELVININQAQEVAVRSATNFVAYQPVQVVGPTTAAQAPGKSLDTIRIYNRAIGVFRGVEVWVKPWVPANYVFCYNTGQPKPAWMRVRGQGKEGTDGKPMSIMGNPAGGPTASSRFGDLILASEYEQFPLRAKQFIREYGVGVWNRVNGAVLYTNSTSAYTNPTIT